MSDKMREALLSTTASLTAAVSLLERGGKKAAASDKMFAVMLDDYRKALKQARAALAEQPAKGDAAVHESPHWFPAAARLALDLECLLLDIKDMPTVTRWWDSAHEALAHWRAAVREVELAAEADPPAPAVPDDTARLNWLEAREASLITHREAIDEGEFAIWWTVTGEIRKIRSNSISGHPLGSVRSAIDAAMLAAAPEVKP